MKYKATYSICSKIQEKEGREKESKKKEFFGYGKSIELKIGVSVIFPSLGGHQLMVHIYEPEKYGVQQIDNVNRIPSDRQFFPKSDFYIQVIVQV